MQFRKHDKEKKKKTQTAFFFFFLLQSLRILEQPFNGYHINGYQVIYTKLNVPPKEVEEKTGMSEKEKKKPKMNSTFFFSFLQNTVSISRKQNI